MKPRRLVSLLVAVCMMVVMLPVSAVIAFAASVGDTFEYEYEGQTLVYKITSVENATVEVTNSPKNHSVQGALKIPASANGYTVTAVGFQAFFGDQALTYVELPSTLKVIGESAFSCCQNLGNLTIPEGVTTIEQWAFNMVFGATSYEIPASVTTIKGEAFANNSVKKVVFAKNSQLTKLDVGIFAGDQYIEEIVLPEGLTEIGDRAFQYCKGMKSITIPAKVKKISSSAFINCFGLEDVYCEGTDETVFDNVTTIDKAKTDIKYRRTVTFDVNGHGTAPEAQTVYTGDKLTKVVEPTAAGYTFGGWYTDKELTKAFDIENDTVSGDTPLYAKWEAIPDHELTVKVGTFTYDDNAASDKGNVYEGALVTVTFDENNQLWKDSGLNFDHWDIQSKAKLLDENGEEIVNPGKTFTFVMPKEGVTIEAMPKDATIEEEEEPNVLGTAAVIGTAAVGTAVLAYQGYQLGTEFYLKYALPAGAAIPANRGELAELVWNDAGKPEPTAVLNADAAETDKAIAWAVENDLLKAAKDNGEAYEATDPVSRIEVIKVWNQAQELK